MLNDFYELGFELNNSAMLSDVLVVTANRVDLPGDRFAYVSDANGDGRETYIVFQDGWFSNPFEGFFVSDPNGNTRFQNDGFSFNFNFRGNGGGYTLDPHAYENFNRVGAGSED